GPDRADPRDGAGHVLAEQRAAVSDLGGGRHRVHGAHGVGRTAAPADGDTDSRGSARGLRDPGRALAGPELHQPVPVPAPLPGGSAPVAATPPVKAPDGSPSPFVGALAGTLDAERLQRARLASDAAS